ncbi:hypothetical protein [Desulforamulus ferrireducens]|uniref:GAPS4 PD-(D/E)XK nuclease domain-containing protein n=1 Tax=Desulforamulus ferrireducens TaxID=1833852 RepID=A0A1S6IUJ3_9FIRM|nr:hypothetical protein [Desulforamulus ferrireducens]AQS58439.1 hypothetical protein B0537_04645 [Desulforamulus ferrireducens]
MSEEQGVSGNHWTKGAVGLLTKLGWEQKGACNIDIPCTQHASRKNPHGIDIFFQYFEPYENKDLGIIVETKRRVWSGASSASIEEFLEQTISTLECAPYHPTFSEKYDFYGQVETALILIWYHSKDSKRTPEYDHDKYLQYISKVKAPRKRKEMNVFIASNYDILRWCSIIDTVEKICYEKKAHFDYYYPCINHNNSLRKPYLSLVHLFSAYIFGKFSYIEDDGELGRTRHVSVVFSSDRPTLTNLMILYSAVKKYMLDDVHELWLYFYDDLLEYRSYCEQFKRSVKEELNKQQKKLKIEILELPRYIDPPGWLWNGAE